MISSSRLYIGDLVTWNSYLALAARIWTRAHKNTVLALFDGLSAVQAVSENKEGAFDIMVCRRCLCPSAFARPVHPQSRSPQGHYGSCSCADAPLMHQTALPATSQHEKAPGPFLALRPWTRMLATIRSWDAYTHKPPILGLMLAPTNAPDLCSDDRQASEPATTKARAHPH